MSESYVYTIEHDAKQVGLTEGFGARRKCLAIITRDEWSMIVDDVNEDFRAQAKIAGVDHVRVKRRADMTVERILARQLCVLFWGAQGASEGKRIRFFKLFIVCPEKSDHHLHGLQILEHRIVLLLA